MLRKEINILGPAEIGISDVTADNFVIQALLLEFPFISVVENSTISF